MPATNLKAYAKGSKSKAPKKAKSSSSKGNKDKNNGMEMQRK
jgi:hypothetical protein